MPGPGRGAPAPGSPRRSPAPAERGRRCGAWACCSASSSTAATPGRSTPPLLDAGCRRQRRHADRAAPGPVAAHRRRRDRRTVGVIADVLAASPPRRRRRDAAPPPRDRRPHARRAGRGARPGGRPARRAAAGRPRRSACYFEKPSLRTRHSCEVAVVQLGGHPLTFRRDEVGSGERETVGRHRPGPVRLPRRARRPGLRPRGCSRSWPARPTIPVVNLLSDRRPPVPGPGRPAHHAPAARRARRAPTVAWVGDFNNVARSLALGATMLRHEGPPGVPAGLRPDRRRPRPPPGARRRAARDAPARTRRRRRRRGAHRRVGVDGPGGRGRRAGAGRSRASRSTTGVMAAAAPDAVFMHCLPAHRGEEVGGEVVDGPQSRRLRPGPQPPAQLPGPAVVADRGGRPVSDQADDHARRRRRTPGSCARSPSPSASTASPACWPSTRSPARAARRAARRPRAWPPPRPPCPRDLEDLGAIKVRVAGGETVYAIPELPHRAAGPRGPPPPGVRRLGGRGGPLRQPRRAAHAARARPTSWLGARPVRRCPACSARWPATTRSWSWWPTDASRRRRTGRSAAATGRALIRPNDPRPSRTPSRRGSNMAKRVVLAYSGGLDTSVAVRWMIDNLGVEVIALAVDVGQSSDDWDVVRQRALAAGAVEADRGRRPRRVRPRLLRPGPQGQRPLRGPLPAGVGAVAAGHREAPGRGGPRHGADAVAHGCTGKGNDQVRFEVSTRALAPDLEVLAPVRSWGMTREESHPLRLRPRHPDHGDEGEGVLHRRQPLGPGHRVRRDGGPVGGAAARGVAADQADRATEPTRRRGRLRRRACRWPSTAWSWARRGDRHAQRAWSAPTAGAASTWSRTAGSASRAARPTSARPAWR